MACLHHAVRQPRSPHCGAPIEGVENRQTGQLGSRESSLVRAGSCLVQGRIQEAGMGKRKQVYLGGTDSPSSAWGPPHPEGKAS